MWSGSYCCGLLIVWFLVFGVFIYYVVVVFVCWLVWFGFGVWFGLFNCLVCFGCVVFARFMCLLGILDITSWFVDDWFWLFAYGFDGWVDVFLLILL